MTQAWEIAAYTGGREVLREVGPMGRFLFDIEERPGLGIDAPRIRATMTSAPKLLKAAIYARSLLEQHGIPYNEARLSDAIATAESRRDRDPCDDRPGE